MVLFEVLVKLSLDIHVLDSIIVIFLAQINKNQNAAKV